MHKIIKYRDSYIIFLIFIFSFSVNYYVGSRGVFPIDTFMHYDPGYRILLGEAPVKDFWIVHGFLIDYLQAIFFKIFGNFWHSYIIHSSLINVLVAVFSYYIFRILQLNLYHSFLLSILISLLSYPVSGTPFLDLHSSFFSLIAIFFGIMALKQNNYFYWFWMSIMFCVSFFSKQVPAAYSIILTTLLVFGFSLETKKKKIIIFYLSGALVFSLLLYIFLIFQKIPIKDFFLQIFLFPQSIGSSRFENYNLNLNNLILEYKFIYIPLIALIFLNILSIIKKKNYLKSEDCKIFLLILFFSLSSIFHQIYTKNQTYIYFLIPLLSGFLIFFLKDYKFKRKEIFIILILAYSIFSTIKYNDRYNIKRHFHELTNTNLQNAIRISLFDKKLNGLKWITPHFDEPKEELRNIEETFNLISLDKKNKMLITDYNFYSSLTEQKLHSPSRTYDNISYPEKDNKFYIDYKNFFIKKLKMNNIENIYVFETKKIDKLRLNHLIFNYVPQNCFSAESINAYTAKLKIIKCNELDG